MGKRERLDLLLVERQLVLSREDGRRRILAGEVLVNEQRATKAGSLVDPASQISLKAVSPYVSRGGIKLEKALREFNLDVRGKSAIDVGASTGGFTDCLLAHGVAKVIAVDVGYGQLDWKLRNDPRVIVYEKTNIRYLAAKRLPFVPELATIDASFISLKLILPKVQTLIAPNGSVVALIKPQFEVGRGKVGKGGVVRSAEEHVRVIDEIQQAARAAGYAVLGVTDSPLVGPKGNREFLILLRLDDPRQRE